MRELLLAAQPHHPRPVRAAEFFAGIGLAGLGLSEAGIETVWSNDISADKYRMHRHNFGDTLTTPYVVADLGQLTPEERPRHIDLAWASFPCTDLSLAGGQAGLSGAASSAFWHFVKIISAMKENKPRVIAIENVPALATSRSGDDIFRLVRSLNGLGYSVDALLIDAKHFVAQSRPRLFIIGCLEPPQSGSSAHPARPTWLTKAISKASLRTHQMDLPDLPEATHRLSEFVECIDDLDERWWSAARVEAYVSSLSELQYTRLTDLLRSEALHVRTSYRRMRAGVPRWEMRADEIAGCLRTSRGGSSRQAVVFAGRASLKIRWMTPKEYANLMGTPSFKVDGLPSNLAYSGFGDAVCAPVVAWLARNYLRPLVGEQRRMLDSTGPDMSLAPEDLALAAS